MDITVFDTLLVCKLTKMEFEEYQQGQLLAWQLWGSNTHVLMALFCVFLMQSRSSVPTCGLGSLVP